MKRGVSVFGLIILMMGLALPAMATIGPVEKTPIVSRSVRWNSVIGKGLIEGYKKPTLSQRTPSGVWTNKANFSLRQRNRDDLNVRGTYGKLYTRTNILIIVQLPGGGKVPRIVASGAEGQTQRTKRTRTETVKTTQKIGITQRGGWTRSGSVCLDLVLRPDKCSSEYTW